MHFLHATCYWRQESTKQKNNKTGKHTKLKVTAQTEDSSNELDCKLDKLKEMHLFVEEKVTVMFKKINFF